MRIATPIKINTYKAVISGNDYANAIELPGRCLVSLDNCIQLIEKLVNRFHRAIAFHALCQACIVKRPYNLFHRKNLNIRTCRRHDERSDGNRAPGFIVVSPEPHIDTASEPE